MLIVCSFSRHSHGRLVLAESVRPPAAVEHPQHPQVASLEHQQDERRRGGGYQQQAFAGRGPNRNGGQDGRGSCQATDNVRLLQAEYQASADETDTG